MKILKNSMCAALTLLLVLTVPFVRAENVGGLIYSSIPDETDGPGEIILPTDDDESESDEVHASPVEMEADISEEIVLSLEDDDGELDEIILVDEVFDADSEGSMTAEDGGAENDGSADVAASDGDSAQGDDSAADDDPTPRDVPVDPMILLENPIIELGVGESVRIGATYLSSGGEEEAPVLTFSRDNKNASVTTDGVVKGLKIGKTMITVSGGSAAPVTCEVNVLKAPDSISLNAKKAILGFDPEVPEEDAMRFQIVAKLSSKSASAITYSGYDASIVDVDTKGLVTPKGIGETTVTAKTFNKKSAKIAVVVKRAPDAVTLNANELTIGQGDTYRLSATIAEDSVSSLEYYIQDETDCAAIDPLAGTITALAPGWATVCVRTFNGKKAECVLQVVDAPTSVMITDPNGQLLLDCTRCMGVGESMKLSAWPFLDDVQLDGTVKFSSSRKSVATVGADGVIKAKGKGWATITASACNGTGAIARFNVHVINAPTGIKLNASKRTLGLDVSEDGAGGEQFTLVPKLSSGSASMIKYYGYDSSVVSVAHDGTVTARGIGTTTITAKTFNKKKATCEITVLNAPDSISMNRESVVIGAGETFAVKGVLPSETASLITYTSSAPEYVTVDKNGVLTGVAEGEAEILAETYNHVSPAVCHVTVMPKPSAMKVTPGTVSIGVGEKDVTLDVLFDGRRLDGACSFKSTNTKYVKVSSKGTITGVAKGKATVNVTSYYGKVIKVPVTVSAVPNSVKLSPDPLIVELGGTGKLKATCPKGQASKFSFISDDESVADVDDKGIVHGVSLGSTSITASTFNGKTDSCIVNVIPPAGSVEMRGRASLVRSLYSDYPIEVLDIDGNPYQGTFDVSFDPKGVASWSNGRLLGKKIGNTIMTVTAGGVSRSCMINVISYRSVYPVLSIAHRGGCGHNPENTLKAFRHAIDYGADGVELDVHTSKDGVQVVHHDEFFIVNKKKYKITDWNYADLKNKKPSLCTLEEAIAVIRDSGLKLHLEMKSSADGARCVEIVREYGMEDRTVFFSFYNNTLRAVYAADPTAILGKSLNTSPSKETVQGLKDSLHLSFLVANYKKTTQVDIDDWHRMGLKVCVWTINSKKEVGKFCDMDVDYILSDYPEYCVQVR